MRRRFHIFNRRMLSNLMIVLIGILFFLFLSNLNDVGRVIGDVISIISPFLWGIFIAYLLNTPTQFFMRKVYKKFHFKRAFSITTVYLIALILIGVIVALIVPQVINSAVTLVNNLPIYMNNLDTMITNLTDTLGITWNPDELLNSYESLLDSAFNLITNELPNVLTYGISVGSSIISIIIAIIASIYMLSGKDRLVHQIKAMLYAIFPTRRVHRFLVVCRQSDRIFIGFVNGKLIDSAIVGCLCAILCLILQIPMVPLISVVIGVTNIIPFFGPFIGAIPSILILLMIDPWAALRFAIMIIVLQQVDGNLIGPKILGNYTGLSPIWVLVAITVGGGLFGVLGMVLGVPVFAVIYRLVRNGINNRLKKKNLDAEGRDLGGGDAEAAGDPPGEDPPGGGTESGKTGNPAGGAENAGDGNTAEGPEKTGGENPAEDPEKTGDEKPAEEPEKAGGENPAEGPENKDAPEKADADKGPAESKEAGEGAAESGANPESQNTGETPPEHESKEPSESNEPPESEE